MDRRKFEALLKETLEEKSMPVSMPQNRKQEMLKNIKAQSEKQSDAYKEETAMRLGFKKKVVLVAAAMCIFGTIAALAAGKITGYYTGTRVDQPSYKNFAELSAVEADTGFAMKVVEEFDNGYRFRVGYKTDTEARDDAGNVVESFPEVMLFYENGGHDLTITAHKVRAADEPFEGKVTSTEYEGRTLLYKEDQYMFAPPSYEPSEDVKKAVEAGELYLSFGTDEIEYDTFHFMQWDDDGTRYLLISNDENAPGQEEMESMAKQIIDSAN
ncbi:hypothetical protein [Clostridium sp. AN503]|uniref:hypothetical protein n=1 Tax=Clostridium sp. AN503 TaxID=3160598 RepID=UPI00345ADB42